MTNAQIVNTFKVARRLWNCPAPRKILLTTPRDRSMAAIWIVNARIHARAMGVKGYDRHLLMAATHASLGGEDHIARQLAEAALD